jgi:hypothetical protein
VSIWDGGWPDQPEPEREGDWFKGNPEPCRGEDTPPEEEFGDKASDPMKPNPWPRAELAGHEYKMFQMQQHDDGRGENGDER